MRLICPNCGAQYEVPLEVIPEDGRDVQCSNCGHTWFQPHPDHDVGLREEDDETLPGADWDEDEDTPLSAAPAPAPEPRRTRPAPPPAPEPEPEVDPEDLDEDQDDVAPVAAPRARGLDPKVADVLREEAEREARARAAEARGLESQPDLGLGEPDTTSAPRKRRAAEAASATRPAAQTGEGRSRGAMLPDIDEINSTLRSTSERREMETAQARAEAAYEEDRPGGFRKGLSWAFLVAILAVALYLFGPRLAEAVPALAPVLDSYGALIDGARVWLDGQLGHLLGQLDGMSSEAAPPATDGN